MLENIRESSQSLLVRIAFGLIIVVFIFWGIGAYTPNVGLVASVNGQDITEQDFAAAYNAQIERLMAVFPDMQINDEMIKSLNLPYFALEALITQVLLEQEAKRTGFEVGAKELLATIATFPFAQDAQGNFSLEEYKKVFENAGQSPKAFEALLQKELREGKYRELFAEFAFISEEQVKQLFEYQYKARNFDAYYITTSNFTNSAKVSDAELEALYQAQMPFYQVPANVQVQYIEITPENLAKKQTITEEEIKLEYETNRALYDLPETVTASHILVAVPNTANAQVEEEALAKIKNLQNRIANGASFASLAQENSDDPGSASRGGALGEFTRGQMVPEFEEIAFQTPVGKVSNPVRSDFGYHLIYVQGKQEAGPRNEAQTRQMIIQDLSEAKALSGVQTSLDSILVQLHADKANANLNDLAKKEGLEAQTSPLMPLDQLAYLLDIQVQDAQALSQLGQNTILDTPLQTNSGYLVVKVIENEPSRVLTFEEVKDTLIEDAKEIAAQKMALEKAEEALANTNAIPKAQIKSYQMARNGVFPLGNSPDLANAIFQAPESSPWLDRVFSIDGGYIIAKPTKTIEANPSLWQSEKSAQMENMQASRENLIFSMYINQLRSEADIKILNQAYFQ